MREFKIYGEIGSNPDTPKFRAFVKNIETEINENEEIVNRSKNVILSFRISSKRFWIIRKMPYMSVAWYQGCNSGLHVIAILSI